MLQIKRRKIGYGAIFSKLDQLLMKLFFLTSDITSKVWIMRAGPLRKPNLKIKNIHFQKYHNAKYCKKAQFGFFENPVRCKITKKN